MNVRSCHATFKNKQRQTSLLRLDLDKGVEGSSFLAVGGDFETSLPPSFFFFMGLGIEGLFEIVGRTLCYYLKIKAASSSKYFYHVTILSFQKKITSTTPYDIHSSEQMSDVMGNHAMNLQNWHSAKSTNHHSCKVFCTQ